MAIGAIFDADLCIVIKAYAMIFSSKCVLNGVRQRIKIKVLN